MPAGASRSTFDNCHVTLHSESVKEARDDCQILDYTSHWHITLFANKSSIVTVFMYVHSKQIGKKRFMIFPG